MKKFLPVLVLLFLFSILFWPVMVFGLDPSVNNPIGSLSESGEDVGEINKGGKVITGMDDLVKMITRIINWFAWFVALASVVMGLYSGMLFITARGNATQLATARQILFYAVIGIVVAIISFSIVIITKTFVGLSN